MFGGIAKLKADWLLDAQPLSLWLGRSSDVPLLGQLFASTWAPHLMSWAGALFDLSIVPLLLWRRSRPLAYVAVVGFHLLTARLFSLGMFPYFMICGSLLFLAPDWPRRAVSRWSSVVETERERAQGSSSGWESSRWLRAGLVIYFALQVLIPLRHLAYPGQMCWTEQGFRFSWNVMLMEKDGAVDFRVVERGTGRTFHVSPRAYFTPYQSAMMAPQPDMVLEAARLVAADFRARGVDEPAVFADAFASLNGRPMRRLIDPNIDLSREVDGLANKPWILPMSASQEAEVATLGSYP